MLSTGDAAYAALVSNPLGGSNSVNLGIPVSSANQALVKLANDTYGVSILLDTVMLTFEMTPAASGGVSFQYVFGSEEYPAYAPPNSGKYVVPTVPAILGSSLGDGPSCSLQGCYNSFYLNPLAVGSCRLWQSALQRRQICIVQH